MPKLNQILAIEKGTKSRIYGAITTMHHTVQKPVLLNGFSKTYQKKDEDGDDYPPETQRVQVKASDMLRQAGKLLSELFDVTSTKDWANTEAKADLVVDGETLLTGAPATFLLFVEKQLSDLQTFVNKLPVLDPAEDWSYDESADLYKAAPSQTSRTKKVQKAIVLYPATEKHPAQTQLISEDVVVGTWHTVKHSGALPAPRKQELLDRIERLMNAVKFAREQANSTEAPRQELGRKIFDYLLS
jgi:hypothetical protein